MAKFEMQLPNDIIKQFEEIYGYSDEIFGAMTKAGAEVVAENLRNNAPDILKPYVKITRIYRTLSDGGINTKTYFSGYIPFSDPNRTKFLRRGANSQGKVYESTEGVPAEFLANLYEYGRSTAPFPKHPSLRKSFNEEQIRKAMLDVQKKMSGGLLE